MDIFIPEKLTLRSLLLHIQGISANTVQVSNKVKEQFCNIYLSNL